VQVVRLAKVASSFFIFAFPRAVWRGPDPFPDGIRTHQDSILWRVWQGVRYRGHYLEPNRLNGATLGRSLHGFDSRPRLVSFAALTKPNVSGRTLSSGRWSDEIPVFRLFVAPLQRREQAVYEFAEKTRRAFSPRSDVTPCGLPVSRFTWRTTEGSSTPSRWWIQRYGGQGAQRDTLKDRSITSRLGRKVYLYCTAPYRVEQNHIDHCLSSASHNCRFLECYTLTNMMH